MIGSDRDRELLAYIKESIDKIWEYTEGGCDLPRPDTVIEDAVLRRLETLSDAAGHLSEPLKRRHANIPWPKVIAFRNILAHGYIGVEPELAWRVVTDYLPTLETAVLEELDR
ncbi:MAG: HepT-like ribonuclease domain-containing protein [Candidatus Dormibacteraceae bacterium]